MNLNFRMWRKLTVIVKSTWKLCRGRKKSEEKDRKEEKKNCHFGSQFLIIFLFAKINFRQVLSENIRQNKVDLRISKRRYFRNAQGT